ncbi:MAG: helix-turn-helix transcriptional regulator, partial [Legionellales bacterium]|nr:helix-turn-helix transcriptional regulator [Legionellales bacterium]
TQCGILELDSSGYGLIVGNRPAFAEVFADKKGYKVDPHFVFSADFQDGIKAFTSREEYELLYLQARAFYGQDFGIHHGFVWQERIDQNIQRIYFFGSNTPEIYNSVVNNISMFKKFLKFFKTENNRIIADFRNKKFNVADNRENYFVENNNEPFSKRKQLNKLLHNLGLLEKNKFISKREWQCIEMLQLGHSAAKTGEILHISRRTVETHFESIKNKLGVYKKSDIIEVIN